MFKELVAGSQSLVELKNRNHVHFINFDNAATTPPLNSVLNSIKDFSPYYSSVHRGGGFKSEISSIVYENARKTVLDFIKADKAHYTAIFLKNTTECINKLSYRLKEKLRNKVVLTTYMEHHSNMLPWRDKYETNFVEVDGVGRLCLEDLEFKLQLYRGRVGLVCVTGASNVTGYVNPIHKIARLCHKYGAKILVDGAQLIPHASFDLKPIDNPEHIDFVAFSAHKMYAPFGIGVLVAPKESFSQGCSEIVGGGTVKFVSMDDVIWEDAPEKEEAGTPNLMGVVALVDSIKTMERIGMDYIEQYERALTSYALYHMKQINGVILYDDFNVDEKVSIISFNVAGYHHTRIAEMLSKKGGIAVRNGCFCAQPYVQRLLGIKNEDVKKFRNCDKSKQPGMVRISFGFYNDYNEIDLFLYQLRKIASETIKI